MNAGDPKLHYSICSFVVTTATCCCACFMDTKHIAQTIMFLVLTMVFSMGPELKYTGMKWGMVAIAVLCLATTVQLDRKPVVRDWQNKTKYLELNDTVAELQKTIAELRRDKSKLIEDLDFNLGFLEQCDVHNRELNETVLELQKTIAELT